MFGCVGLDWIGFEWVWLVLAGFGYVWLGLVRVHLEAQDQIDLYFKMNELFTGVTCATLEYAYLGCSQNEDL